MAKTKRKAAGLHNMHSYFGKKGRSDDPVAGPDLNEQEQEPEHVEEEISVPPITPTAAPPPPPVQRSHDDSPVLVVQRDPGLRCQIWDHPPNDQEKARLAYMKHGPYQFHKDEYPLDDAANHPRKFQYHWFKTFPWLEYSPIKDAVYCFPYFLFYKKPLGKKGSDKFTVDGFRKWKKVNNGKDCAFLTHMGKDSKSAHNYAVKCYDNLKNKSCHMEQLVEKQTEENIKRNRLRLKVTIDVLRWLTFQACAFRGHDESPDSTNQGNFLEMVKLLAAYDDEIGAVVLGNARHNQVGTLQRPCDTRWSSHYASVCSLLKLYKPTFLVLKSIATSKGSGTSPSARAKANGTVKLMMSFDFIFILHVMKELMGITDMLCKKLQQKSQDIVNAMDDVKTTKLLIQQLRDNGWSKLKADVLSFCGKQGVKTPHFGELYVDFINSRVEDESTVEHHYRCDIFMVVVDQQAQELNCRFNKQITELLIMCTSLDPRNSFSSLDIDIVCSLASKFYPADFEEQERDNLRCQLRHYEHDIPTNPQFQNLITISQLCQQLAATGKNDDYHLIDRLIRLVLTLPVSTATTERAFSAMKLVKTRLRNKMEDGFLRDCLVTYIEKEIAVGITTDAIIDEFDEAPRRVDFN